MLHKQRFYLIGGKHLHQTGLRFRMMLILVVELKLQKSGRVRTAGLIHLFGEDPWRHQVIALAILHHMG